MKKYVVYLLSIIALACSLPTHAETVDKGCSVTYFAKTADHRGNVFVCANTANLIFAYGQVESTHPEVLLVVPKEKVLVKTYESVKLGPVGYELFIPHGNAWYVISSKLLNADLLKIAGGKDVITTPTHRLEVISTLKLDKIDERNEILKTRGVLNLSEELN